MLLLTSCSSCDAYNAYELYETARVGYLDGFEAKVSLRMIVGEKSSEGSFLVKTAGDHTSMIREGSTDERHFVDGVAYQRGYIVGGNRYQDTDEQQPARIKKISTKDEFKAENSTFFMLSPYAETFPVFTPEDLKDVKVESGDGQRFFAAEISADAIRTYFGDPTIPYASGLLAATFDGDGNMLQLILYMDIGADSENVKSFEIVYSFQNIGTVPTVSAPTQSYTDLSP